MSQQNLTKLEAVNRILRAAREHPVATLGEGGESDTLIAEQILDEVTRREQMVGLHLNQTTTSFTPNATTHRVILPNNTSAVTGFAQHGHRDFFFREVDGELRLFNGYETPATDLFPNDEKVYVRITQFVTFESLPVVHQFSVTDQAAFEYAATVLPSNSMLRILEQRAMRSRAMARAADIRSRPHNLLNDGRPSGLRLGRTVARSWPFNDSKRID